MKKKCVKVMVSILLLSGVSSFTFQSYAIGWLDTIEKVARIAQSVKELVGGGGGKSQVPCWSAAESGNEDYEYVNCAGCQIRQGKPVGTQSTC